MKPLDFDCQHCFPTGFALQATFRTDHPVTAVFGPSGSGKSTLLRIIGGLLRPNSGLVTFGAQVLIDSRRRIFLPPEHRRVGMVFQDHLLFPHLSVEANLRYGQRRSRTTSKEGVQMARVVEVLEVGDLLKRMPRNLSGGERQRVTLGRALLSSPQLLLLDEPLAALDEPLKERILVDLERIIAEWRVPIVYVSHTVSEVRRLAGWVVWLDQGRVLSSGPADEILPRLATSDSLGDF